MAGKTEKTGKTQPGIRQLWGIAKSPELKLTDEELHLLVEGYTGKSSIKDLNQREMRTVIRVLVGMKDSARQSERGQRHRNGNIATENQRKKIYRLVQELGWDKPSRLSGMCSRMFGVTSVEWLDYMQCSKLIEALKAMEERQEREAAQDG
ncbi:MAG: regulatory protein GemA [bacterium]|nr:regulatory protein GemA [bacterium]MCM1376107.1 regulatory protein GemA [Muribaculum sp.]